MIYITAYLSFNGNCRKAMKFYQKCLGGDLSFQTISETTNSRKLPATFKKKILNAVLTNDQWRLIASDIVSDDGLKKGNNMSLFLNCGDLKQMKSVYQKLSENGTTVHPIELNELGFWVGTFTDKFGNSWILNSYKN